MKRMHTRLRAGIIAAALVVLSVPFALAGSDTDDARLAVSVEELRNAVGNWSVVTRFLNPDGTTARELGGEYEFEWVVEDRVVRGYNYLPELDQKSAILFYVSEKKMTIEMVAVGADGNLWIMTGPAGGDTRYSQEFKTDDGTTSQLRFTRFNASADRFESRMEYSSDGGTTWVPGNHQVFTRRGETSETP